MRTSWIFLSFVPFRIEAGTGKGVMVSTMSCMLCQIRVYAEVCKQRQRWVQFCVPRGETSRVPCVEKPVMMLARRSEVS